MSNRTWHSPHDQAEAEKKATELWEHALLVANGEVGPALYYHIFTALEKAQEHARQNSDPLELKDMACALSVCLGQVIADERRAPTELWRLSQRFVGRAFEKAREKKST